MLILLAQSMPQARRQTEKKQSEKTGQFAERQAHKKAPAACEQVQELAVLNEARPCHSDRVKS